MPFWDPVNDSLVRPYGWSQWYGEIRKANFIKWAIHAVVMILIFMCYPYSCLLDTSQNVQIVYTEE